MFIRAAYYTHGCGTIAGQVRAVPVLHADLIQLRRGSCARGAPNDQGDTLLFAPYTRRSACYCPPARSTVSGGQAHPPHQGLCPMALGSARQAPRRGNMLARATAKARTAVRRSRCAASRRTLPARNPTPVRPLPLRTGIRYPTRRSRPASPQKRRDAQLRQAARPAAARVLHGSTAVAARCRCCRELRRCALRTS